MYTWWKNIFDRFLALLALVIFSPLLAIIAIAIRFDSSGSSIFRQERVGKDGHRFTIYKFRTMYEDSDDIEYKIFLQKYLLEGYAGQLDQNGQTAYELAHGPRVTRFGRLLRRTGLDELLQLINVLKGEMALIGPRPDIPFTVAMYQPHHYDRLRIKPGITGLWQISGRRILTFEEMVRLDVDYINKQSLLLDGKIALLTIREILARNGR